MKVVHIIAEGFNSEDAKAASLADLGFKEYAFDGRPVVSSVEGLYAVQTGLPYAQRNQSVLFDGRKVFLANYVKTRIFSRPFPLWTGIENLDPLTRFTQQEAWHEGNPVEPDSKLWGEFGWFLRKLFKCSDYQHLIYCAILGHVDWRLPVENRGVPVTLRKTFSRFVGLLLNDVLPYAGMGQNMVVIHPDHGTTREGQAYDKSMFETFLWVHAPKGLLGESNTVADWDSLRGTLCRALGVPPGSIGASGRTLE